ncbi:hypothetical protein [Streptomyces decoyicus]|uniref:hypothetical protein n=1 Tax=Streptomyces decoyicus TaxID=249567 RepID=UPI0038647929|nr:hypothetical protein OG532_20880 [Streptomyces decoyicus]
MRYRGEGIPHFATDPDICTFFEVALGVEWIDDIDKSKGNVASDTTFSRHLREALEYLLRERPVTAKQWGQLNHVFFYEDDRLYAYLQDLYDYFYGDRQEPPEAPDPEAPPPDWYWE